MTSFRRFVVPAFAIIIGLGAISAFAEPNKQYGKIEIVRDGAGTPNVFSDTDAGAMYGLGFAMAEDRLFQMVYHLRIMQGRMAETVGDFAKVKSGVSALASDRAMRTTGFYRAAKQTAENLDDETKGFLRAFSEGINDYIAENRGNLGPLFKRYSVEPEPWTPADAIASWWHSAMFFAGDGLSDEIVTNFGKSARKAKRMAENAIVDDDAAVVRREDVADEWVAKVNAFIDSHGLERTSPTSPVEGPKFSHGWVVGGAKTTTGSAVLVSDPQMAVCNPSFLYEFHICGKTFNARGAGAPGSPGLLIGFTPDMAWGLTALAADQADLFLYKKDPAHPNQYQYDGVWKDMKVREETIKVKGGAEEKITIRETLHGPIVSTFAQGLPEGWEAAQRRVPICETDRDTIQAAIGMIRAKDVKEFTAALPGWRFPTANAFFGAKDGSIGYWALGALPARSSKALWWGNCAHDGSSSVWEWQGMILYDLLPHVINPKGGWLVSANHRPVQSFYQLPFGASIKSTGDTERGLRVKQKIQDLFAAKDKLSPADVLSVEYDGRNPVRYAVLRIGYSLRQSGKCELSPTALKTLDYLDKWYKDGAQEFSDRVGTELAENMQCELQTLSKRYGSGGGGASRFAKDIEKRFRDSSTPAIAPEEAAVANQILSGNWDKMVKRYGADSTKWHELAVAERKKEKLLYYRGLDGFPSLDPQYDIPLPQLIVNSGISIWSQRSQAYTQFVPLDDADSATSLLPIGASERPDNSYRLSALKDWAKGVLRPAPLSHAKVEKLAVSRRSLSGEMDNKAGAVAASAGASARR